MHENTDGDAIRHLKRNRAIGHTLKWVFQHLWEEIAAGRPDRRVVRVLAVAEDLGADPRTVRSWLAKLQEADLIHIVDHDEQRGTYLIDIYHPNPGARQHRPDPQMRLPLQEVCADQFAQTDPRADHLAQSGPDHFAQTDPRDEPAQQSPESSQLSENLASHRLFERLDEHGSADQFAQTDPRSAPMGTMDIPIEEKRKRLTHHHRQYGSMDHGADRFAQDDPRGEVTVAQIVAEAVAARGSPAATQQAKVELVAYLVEAIGDPLMDESIPNRAADAVIELGFSVAELKRIAEATRRKRVADEITTSPGAYFLSRIRRACPAAFVTRRSR